MVGSLRNVQKDYEEYLLALQTEKKGIKKFLSKIETIAKKNAELGIEVDAETLAKNKQEELLNAEIEITKVKKVIHRLGKCIEIMTEEINEVQMTDIEEIEE